MYAIVAVVTVLAIGHQASVTRHVSKPVYNSEQCEAAADRFGTAHMPINKLVSMKISCEKQHGTRA